MKKYLLFLLVILVASGIAGYFYTQQKQTKIDSISSFEECAAAGYPIMESYPPRCAVPGGKTFTQEIGNELELHDLITIQNPRPNQTIASPLEVRGAARGTWFFEASFPVKLVDENGKTLAEAPAQAQGEWMTEEFVPYKVDLKFNTDAKRGLLILMKDNPSGLPENDRQLEIPVVFK